MRSLKVLITGAGAPGIKGTIYSLKENYDKRKIYIIGTDMKEDVVGQYLCDKFYVIPKASESQRYLTALYNLCNSEGVDVIIPQNTMELLTLSNSINKFKKIGVSILISNIEAIEIANNKLNIMSICQDIGIPIGQFYEVDDFEGLIESAKKIGWPQKKIVVKPPISNGQRGVRIIDESINLKEKYYTEKPNSMMTKMDILLEILGEKFPKLIVMEYLSGDEYTVDVLKTQKKITVIPRKRDLIRSGITFNGTVEKNELLIRYSKLLSEKIGLKYCFGYQFKMDDNCVPKLLEANPRVQGTMVLSTFAGANIIYTAVKELLNEKLQDLTIDWGTKIYRYWGGVRVNNHSKDIISL